MYGDAFAPTSQRGYVYIATTQTYIRQNWYKIGHTNNVGRRLRDLGAASGVPEQFFSHIWYAFETLEAAKETERHIHSHLDTLGKRVPNWGSSEPLRKREFFEESSIILTDEIEYAARQTGNIFLRNYFLSFSNCLQEFELMIPCAFFLLSEEINVEHFLEIAFLGANLHSDLAPRTDQQAPCMGHFAKGFNLPFGSERDDFLRRNAYLPLIPTLMKDTDDERLRSWAQSEIDEFQFQHGSRF